MVALSPKRYPSTPYESGQPDAAARTPGRDCGASSDLAPRTQGRGQPSNASSHRRLGAWLPGAGRPDARRGIDAPSRDKLRLNQEPEVRPPLAPARPPEPRGLRFTRRLGGKWAANWRGRSNSRFRSTGRPDFAFPQSRLAVFVDGCFWHGCPKHLRLPASHRTYWVRKIERNVARDHGYSCEGRTGE